MNGSRRCDTQIQWNTACVHAQSLQSCPTLWDPMDCRLPWIETPLSMEFSRQEYWSGLPCPPPGGLPDPGIKPTSHVSRIGTTGLVPHPGACLLEAFSPQACRGRAIMKERCWKNEPPVSHSSAWRSLLGLTLWATNAHSGDASSHLQPFTQALALARNVFPLPVSWWGSSHSTRHHLGSRSSGLSWVDNSSVCLVWGRGESSGSKV